MNFAFEGLSHCCEESCKGAKTKTDASYVAWFGCWKLVNEQVFCWGISLRSKRSSFPSPTPFTPPFCSRPIFRAARMRKTPSRGPNFVRFVQERLLRRLLGNRVNDLSAWSPFFYRAFSLSWLAKHNSASVV